MSSSNGILVDGLIAGGMNTPSSLGLMLTKSKDLQANYDLNLVDLVKSAGFKTYWLSNQGFFGRFDTPVSMIANRSDEAFFKKINYDVNKRSDFSLLEPFKKVLASKTDGKKFIVIHLYGSHMDACQRIEDFKNNFKVSDDKYKALSCYVASIEKTDGVLKQIFNALQASKQSFSMLYFSDHGQGQRLKDGSFELYHSDTSKAEYEIPLFMVNSNSNERKTCTSFKSGINFTQGVANWMGIKNPQINPNYNLFDCVDDEEDYDYKEKLSKLEDDKPIDISTFLKNLKPKE